MANKESSAKGSGYSSEQAKASQQMVEAMEKMARFAPIVERSFVTQADVLSKMSASMQAFASQQTVDNLTKICDALKCISDSVGNIDPSKLAALGAMAGSSQTIIVQITESVRDLGQNINGIDSTPVSDFTESISDAGGQIDKSLKNEFRNLIDHLQKKFPRATAIATAALSGLVQGFKNLVSMSKVVYNFFSTLIKSVVKLSLTIISIPLKIFNGLIDMADKGGGGISELAEAINNMRKEFGALSGPTNSAIMGTAKAMGNLKLAGTSVVRVFGNKADRLKLLTELYAQSGSNLRSFEKEILSTNGAAIALQKGLGLTAENMESFAARAKSTGQPITKMLINVTKQADQMGKAFGLDAKIISKEMGKAAQDFKNFGNVSEKQLAVAVTYAEKLGIKLDKIAGTMDAFGTFDDAADNVSKLNEAFGTNIDAMEILQAQSPEEKMEILRREMRKAGVEGEKLNAAQRKLIAGAAGMDDQTSIAAFSTKNYGIALKDIKKEGDKAEKKTLTQAEAINKLADGMERMLKSGESGLTGGKGLLGAFLNGISRGIQMHPAWIDMMKNIRMTIFEVFSAGIKVGKAFVDMFPGILKMIQAITKIFDPLKVKALMASVTQIFSDFFSDLTDPTKKGSVRALMTRLQKVFFNFFDKKSPEGAQLLEGFYNFRDAIVRIFSELAVYVVQELSKVIREITEWIKNPKMPKVNASAAWMKPLLEVFKEGRDKLVPALIDMFDVLWEKISPKLQKAAEKAMPIILGAAFAPAVLKGVLTSVAFGLSNAVAGMLKDIIFGSAAKKEAVAGLKAEARSLEKMALSELQHAERLAATATNQAGKDAAARAFANAERLAQSSLQASEQAAAKGASKFARLAGLMKGPVGAALKILGLPLLIATASVDISNAMKKFGDDLQKKGFDPATAKIAAGSTGIINALTFGLLPEAWQSKIADTLASAVKKMFELFDKWFGPGFSDSIKKFLVGTFDLFAGLGDLLIAMWNGDSKGVNEAIKKMAVGFMDLFFSQFEMIANVLLKIGPLILEYLFKALGWVSNKIGDIFLSLKDIPVVGFIFDWIGSAFKLLGDFFNKAGKGWEMIGDILKQVNVTQVLRDFGNAVIDFAALVWDKFTWLADVITMPVRLAYNFWKTAWLAIWEEVVSPIIGFVTSWAVKIFNLFVTPYKKLWVFIKETFSKIQGKFTENETQISSFATKVYDFLTWPYKKAWEVILSVAGFVWDTYNNLLEKFRVWGHEILDILQDPHKKAFDKIKEVLEKVWTAYKELPGKLIAWGVELLGKITAPFKGAWEWLKKNFSIEKFKEIGKAMLDGILSTLKDLPGRIKGIFKEGVAAAKKAVRMGSPSKDTAEIGQAMLDGTMNSLDPLPEKVGKKYAEASASAASSAKAPSISETGIPDKDALENLLKSLEAMSSSLKISGDLKGQIDSFIAGAQGLAESFVKLPEAMKPIIETLGKINNELFAGSGGEDAVKTANSIAEVFEGIDKLATLGKAMAAGPKGSGDAIGDKIWALNQVCGHIAEELTTLAGPTGFPLIAEAMTGIKKSVAQYGDLSAVSETTNSLIEVLNNVDALGKSAKKIADERNIDNNISSFNEIMSGILDGLQSMPDFVLPVFEFLAKEFPNSTTSLSKALQNVNSARMMIARGVLPAVKAVKDMVDAAQEIQEHLARGATIDIDKKLKIFSANSQRILGTGGKYTVTTKDVNINVNFKVVIDAEELASTIVQNKNSVIRQRINLLLSAVPEGESSKKAKEDAAGARFTGRETPPQLTTYMD